MHFSSISVKPRTIMSAVVGSTSTLALVSAGAPAMADGLYAGLSAGAFFGETPTAAAGDAENYELSGAGIGGFVGYTSTMSNGLTLGLELAATGPVEGDPDENSSYEYAYDINWLIDTKLRVGTTLANNISVYGFAGMSFANTNHYYREYSTGGYNFGFGADYDLNNGMFVGVEAIQRDLDGYGDDIDDGRAVSQAISLRAGFKF